MTLGRGQELAREQLAEIADRSAGALEIVREPYLTEQGSLAIHISIATRAYRREGGLAFRDRERMLLLVGADFPFRPPTLWFAHRRFAGTPHVQWGRYVCLYQSVDAEWRPADGMYGLMQRVDEWLAAAGAGALDPDDAPLHPPVAYTEASTKIVIRQNAPAADGALWVGRADLETVNPARRDLVGWASMADWDAVPVRGTPAVAILLSRPLPAEYPSNVNDLFKSIEAADVPFGTIWSALRLSAVLVPDGEPGHVVLGAPMRRRAAGEPLRQHLTVWELNADALAKVRAYVLSDNDADLRGKVAEWMVTASVGWCTVLEDRPEIVNRRDRGALVEAMAGRRVALLGCGALGSAVAETLVRAGVSRLRLLDNGIVRPGILVRQRFTDDDVGAGKAARLKARLDGLGLGCEIQIRQENLRSGVLDQVADLEPEFVIDATASRAIAHRLETELDDGRLGCPLITMSVSASAEHGSVAVKMPDCPGGPLAVERQAKLAALARDRAQPLVQAFWPDEPRKELFLPEPGCSSPTFTGSAADIDHHAGGLLNVGLRRAAELAPDAASMDLAAPPWSAMPASGARLLSYRLDGVETTVERVRRYRTFTTKAARTGMATEIRRIGRVKSSKCETGGLLFGEIDDSHGHIWIDSVSGPPPDSELSPERFLCGTAGTKALARRRLEGSGGSSRFIGIWHTHPVSRGRPSNEDLAAMVQLLRLQPHPPRQVAMLIIGFAERRPDPNLYLFHRDDFRFTRIDELPYDLGDG